MPDGSAEKLTFSELLEQFDSAKVHFVNSQREVLLGFREICRIIVRLAGSSKIGIGGDFPVYVVRALGAVIDYLLARVPEKGEPEDILAAKIEAIDELLEILDEEAQRIGKEAKDETDLAKVEAIVGIKKYLLSERQGAVYLKEHPDKAARIRKVTIE